MACACGMVEWGGGLAAQVDYDRIAPTYDARYAANERSGTGAALRALVETRRAVQVLEVGCGTGHWLQELQWAGTRSLRSSDADVRVHAPPRPYGVMSSGGHGVQYGGQVDAI